jgi:hypothetical protein
MARGEGLRVRFARIPGETKKGVLSRAFRLPATLDGFGWTEDFTHTEYDTLRRGQFSNPAQGNAQARSLRRLDDLGTLTVEWDPKWLVERGQDPEDVRRTIFDIGRSRTPVDMLATLDYHDRAVLAMDVTFRSIQTQMKAGEPDTLYYSISIAEWRDPTTGRKGAGKADPKFPLTHKLSATDTLYSLSKLYYGSSLFYGVIADANKITRWGKQTPLAKSARWKVGSKIRIPAPPSKWVRDVAELVQD